MKKIVILSILFFVSITSAQESVLDKISKETCEYLESNDISNLSAEEKQAKLGLKILSLYNKYEKELNKEGLVLDLSGGEEAGYEFGEKVGMNMVQFCPKALMSLVGGDLEEENYEKEQSYVDGEVKKITGEDLYMVELKDTQGKIQKFIWLSNFEGADALLDYSKALKNKEVRVFYEAMEIFSPKLKDYIIRNKIVKLEILK